MDSSPGTLNSKMAQSHELAWQRWGMLYLRLALGAAFLSGIADRFGLYRGRNVGYGNFAGFMRYTAQVNSFMPASMIPFLAWTATLAELAFGLALVLGIWLRCAALGSSILLLLFGTAMAISFGIKSPLDYSVFSASAGALVLSVLRDTKVNACFHPPTVLPILLFDGAGRPSCPRSMYGVKLFSKNSSEGEVSAEGIRESN